MRTWQSFSLVQFLSGYGMTGKTCAHHTADWTKNRKANTAALNLWSKRCGFIGLQLLALKWGMDAGYTKTDVAKWAADNLKAPEEKHNWLPPTDHPERLGRDHDYKRVAEFLNWVISLPESFTFYDGARLSGGTEGG